MARKKRNLENFVRGYFLDRMNPGYTTGTIEGMFIPTMFPADAIAQFGRTFDDFRCCILETGRVSAMVPKIGRQYKVRMTVIVGNGLGVYGVGTTQCGEYMESLIAARSLAFTNLQYAPIYEGRTIPSDGFYMYNK